MQKGLCIVLAIGLFLTACASQGEAERKAAEYLREKYGTVSEGTVPKVILDCDMTYLGDDAMCLCILAEADRLGLIDLLGVAVTGGNSFVAEGTNATLNQLERIGREDIPVYMGTDEPLGGFRDLKEQEKIVGKIDHWGVMYRMEEYVEPEKYHDLGSGYDRKWGYSETDPEAQSAADFMTEQVRQYPGEVTILSVGPATDLALACLLDPSFAPDTAGVIYMGTTLNGQGSYTPYADFNVFYDAEAFDVCLNSGFPSQTIIPSETSQWARLDKAVFDLLDEKGDTLTAQMWLDDQYSLYRRDSSRKTDCVDAIAAVVLLNPDVVRLQEERYVTVDTEAREAGYGRTTTRKGEGQEGVRAAFILEVDTALYWDFVTDLLCHTQEEP